MTESTNFPSNVLFFTIQIEYEIKRTLSIIQNEIFLKETAISKFIKYRESLKISFNKLNIGMTKKHSTSIHQWAICPEMSGLLPDYQ